MPRPPDDLNRLGLHGGENARWKRTDNERYSTGRVNGVESDGSIRVIDAKGATVSIPLDRLEVGKTGPRGAAGWEPASTRGARTEQLGLL
ncbi:MAG: hypothetical protein Q8K63_13870 [Acidimicrobiales bacterium]|nr:hypothetical protein [Acidimicrobiales bacterium]